MKSKRGLWIRTMGRTTTGARVEPDSLLAFRADNFDILEILDDLVRRLD